MNIGHVRQRMEDRTVNYVGVAVCIEADCDASQGEYSMHITGFIGGLDINSYGGVDDVSLIKEAADNFVLGGEFSGDMVIDLVLKESGEWEDVFWHKYYVVERSTIQRL
jgi:hypothetical protein